MTLKKNEENKNKKVIAHCNKLYDAAAIYEQIANIRRYPMHEYVIGISHLIITAITIFLSILVAIYLRDLRKSDIPILIVVILQSFLLLNDLLKLTLRDNFYKGVSVFYNLLALLVTSQTLYVMDKMESVLLTISVMSIMFLHVFSLVTHIIHEVMRYGEKLILIREENEIQEILKDSNIYRLTPEQRKRLIRPIYVLTNLYLGPTIVSIELVTVLGVVQALQHHILLPILKYYTIGLHIVSPLYLISIMGLIALLIYSGSKSMYEKIIIPIFLSSWGILHIWILFLQYFKTVNYHSIFGIDFSIIFKAILILTILALHIYVIIVTFNAPRLPSKDEIMNEFPINVDSNTENITNPISQQSKVNGNAPVANEERYEKNDEHASTSHFRTSASYL